MGDCIVCMADAHLINEDGMAVCEEHWDGTLAADFYYYEDDPPEDEEAT